MDDGIFEIKLVPAWNSPSIKHLLVNALSQSQLLQAGIAYWTVTDRIFGSALTRALAHDSGFLCVDLHLPTDIEALASLVSKGSHVYFYCEEIPTKSEFGQREPPYLVHSKMLLFWKKDRTAELWVGSHNWTNRAILGLNVESSLVIRLRDSSPIFCEAAGYLENIKKVSEELDLSKLEFYKELQRNISRSTIPVIALEATGAGAFSNVTIGFFGTDAADLKELGTVSRDVYVELFDSNTGKTYLYPATILQSGLLSSSHQSAGGISFSRRRHAFRSGHRFPFILPEGEIESEVLRSAAYFVTLSLQSVDLKVVLEYVPNKTASWEVMSEQLSPLLQRLDQNSLKALFGRKGPRIKRPVRMEGQETRALTLIERRSLPELRLVTKRIIRRKD